MAYHLLHGSSQGKGSGLGDTPAHDLPTPSGVQQVPLPPQGCSRYHHLLQGYSQAPGDGQGDASALG